jgi:hypothetical protein
MNAQLLLFLNIPAGGMPFQGKARLRASGGDIGKQEKLGGQFS